MRWILLYLGVGGRIRGEGSVFPRWASIRSSERRESWCEGDANPYASLVLHVICLLDLYAVILASSRSEVPPIRSLFYLFHPSSSLHLLSPVSVICLRLLHHLLLSIPCPPPSRAHLHSFHSSFLRPVLPALSLTRHTTHIKLESSSSLSPSPSSTSTVKGKARPRRFVLATNFHTVGVQVRQMLRSPYSLTARWICSTATSQNQTRKPNLRHSARQAVRQ